jgi:hypothetical protein
MEITTTQENRRMKKSTEVTCKNCEDFVTILDTGVKRCLRCNPLPKGDRQPRRSKSDNNKKVDVPWTEQRILAVVMPKVTEMINKALFDGKAVATVTVDEAILGVEVTSKHPEVDALFEENRKTPDGIPDYSPQKPAVETTTLELREDVAKNWRAWCKKLGIKMSPGKTKAVCIEEIQSALAMQK